MKNDQIARPEDIEMPDWLKNMNWEEYEKFSSIGYSPENIAMYYNIPKIEFMYYFMFPDGDLEYHYKRGILVHQAKQVLTMVDDSSTSVTQAQRLDKLKDKIEFQNARDEIIYGGF